MLNSVGDEFMGISESKMSIEDQIAGFRTRAEDYGKRLDALRRSL